MLSVRCDRLFNQIEIETLTNHQITYFQITERDRHSFLDPSPLRRDSVLWMYGDSVSEQFFWGVRPRPLCTHVFKWCGHTYNWIYQLNGNYRLKIFREKATSAVAGFHAGPLSWSNVFSWREENLSTRGKSLGASETQQQTQPTYDSWPESNPGHIGGRRTLSPLRPPCSPILTKHFFCLGNYLLQRSCVSSFSLQGMKRLPRMLMIISTLTS